MGWLVLKRIQMDVFSLQNLEIWQLALLGVFITSLAIQLFYYLFFFLRFAFYKPTEISSNLPPVTVIICAWNEEENLKQNLQSILEQDYPEYEVIVVNDHSMDETELLIQDWKKRYAHLRLIELNR